MNNAGQSEGIAFSEMPREIWERMLSVNLTGTYLCTRQVLPAMLELKAGRIINIASTAGLRGYSHVTAYCAAKHGVVGLTRALAMEAAKQGITVNAICPSYTDTDMTRENAQKMSRRMEKSQDEVRAMLARLIPRGSLITPAEVANAVLWLCSADGGFATGPAMVVDGGQSVGIS